MIKKIKDKKLIIFDLDGTLTESKMDLDAKTAGLLNKLLQKKLVAVIGGAGYEQFQKQFLEKLETPKPLLKSLFLFPTNSTAFYIFSDGKWRQVYVNRLTPLQKKKIMKAFKMAFQQGNYQKPKEPYGEIIEDRGTQITFSALGQKPPTSKKERRAYLDAKERWNKENDIRPQMMKTLKKHLPEFEVRLGGLTSIDITKKGIDKAYGIRQIRKVLGIPIKEMLFIGDAIYPGGNDYAVKRTGVECIQVKGPEETREIIKALI